MIGRSTKILIQDWGGILFLTTLLLAACNFPGREPTSNLSAIQTSAAQTMVAGSTLSVAETSIVELTPTFNSLTPTFTLTYTPTQTPTQTPTPFPTNTPVPVVPPSATPIPPPPIPCNRAQFISDVTVPDGTPFPPGARFTKIWRLKNTGSCSWNSSYKLVFVKGKPMTDQTAQPLPGVVQPGQMVDLAVNMVAPTDVGNYSGAWMLRDSDGKLFGIGADGQGYFWVKIRVVIPPTGEYAYDLALNFCSADWSSQEGLIGCTNPTDSKKGSVALLTNPRLETRTENELALWVRPNTTSQNGYLRGQYPYYSVKNGDHFVSRVGCMADSSGCDVTFQLELRPEGGGLVNLGSWREIYDSKDTLVDIDISAWSGQKVSFALSIYNNGNVNQANGYWFVPSVRSAKAPTPPPPPTVTPIGQELVFTWQQTGGMFYMCNRLEVYVSGNQAQGKAYSCLNNQVVELGKEALSPDDFAQIVEWINGYAPFSNKPAGEMEDGSIVTLSLAGRGPAQADQSVLMDMHTWASQIFAEISS